MTDTPITTTIPPVQFQYAKYKNPNITVDRLDQLADFVFKDTPVSKLGVIIAGIKLIIAVAYILARKQLLDTELLIAKQEYEQGQSNNTDNNLGHDDLDVKPK